jgi:hypothetical protein
VIDTSGTQCFAWSQRVPLTRREVRLAVGDAVAFSVARALGRARAGNCWCWCRIQFTRRVLAYRVGNVCLQRPADGRQVIVTENREMCAFHTSPSVTQAISFAPCWLTVRLPMVRLS